MNVDDHPSADVVPAMFANTPEGKCLHVDIQIMGVWLMMLMLMFIHDHSNI